MTLPRSKIAINKTKAEAMFEAEQILGSIAEACAWLSHPCFTLGNVAPETLFDTEEHIQLVRDELMRMAYGACV